MTHRLDWIDFAKGVGIILVVIGHVGRGLQEAGIQDARGLLPTVDAVIYAFHMPLFFLLAGVTFGLRPPQDVFPSLATKGLRLLYALVLWTYIFLAMKAVAGDSANEYVSWQDVVIWPLPPYAHLWFLWALALNISFFGLLHFALRDMISGTAFWVIAAIVTLLANLLIQYSGPPGPLVNDALQHSTSFAIGGAIGASRLVRLVPTPATALLGMAAFTGYLAIHVTIEPPLPGTPGGSVLALFLLVPLAYVSSRLAGRHLVSLVPLLGVASFSIYVMHTIFSAALRILLLGIDVDSLWLHLALGVMVGLLCPLAGFMIARRLQALRVLGLG